MENMVKKILSCAGYNHDIRVGDIILAQHVASNLNVSPMQAKQLLDELANAGYLEYLEATEKRVAGWHITQKGIDALK